MSKLQRTPPQNFSPLSLLSSQSVSDSAIHNTPDHYNTTREKRPRLSSDNEETSDFLSEFKQEIKDLISNLMSSQNQRIENLEKHLIKTVCEENTNTKKSIEKTLDTISEQINDLRTNIAVLDAERRKTMLQVSILDRKIENLEKASRKTNIEIRNVPHTTKVTKDDLFKRVQCLLNACDITISNNELRDVYMMPSKDKKSITIIAELPNTLVKERLLNSLKERFAKGLKLDTSIMGLTGPATPIYISENLTPYTRKLHSLARSFCNKYKYKYCWIKNSKIFIRQEEHQPAIMIVNEDTLIGLEKHI